MQYYRGLLPKTEWLCPKECIYSIWACETCLEKSFLGREILCITCKCNHMAIYQPLSKTGFGRLVCRSDMGCPLTFFQFLFVQWSIKRIWLGKRKLLDQDLLLVGCDTGLHFFFFFLTMKTEFREAYFEPFWVLHFLILWTESGKSLLRSVSASRKEQFSKSFNASVFPLLLQWILRKIPSSWDRNPKSFFLFHLCVFWQVTDFNLAYWNGLHPYIVICKGCPLL